MYPVLSNEGQFKFHFGGSRALTWAASALTGVASGTSGDIIVADNTIGSASFPPRASSRPSLERIVSWAPKE